MRRKQKLKKKLFNKTENKSPANEMRNTKFHDRRKMSMLTQAKLLKD